MRVLIIGGTRFVGYLLAWRLIARGDRVTLLNRGTSADPFGDQVDRIRCDRTGSDFQAALARREFDACVDLVCYTGADADGAVRALSGRVGHHVMISTGQVYLVREGCEWPARESDYPGAVMARPADPGDVHDWLYGVEKRAAEDRLEQAWRETRFPATRFRIPMVNGERDYFRRIESYIRRILDGGPVILPDGGSSICRHIYGAEVARTIAQHLGDVRAVGRAFNLSQAEAPPLRELVGILCEIVGAPYRGIELSALRLRAQGLDLKHVSPFSDPWMSRLDPGLARQELGFRHVPLREYLERIVASLLANPPASPPDGYAKRSLEVEAARA